MLFFCRLLIVFKVNLFEKLFSGIPSECQTVWIQILIWVQTVRKGYQRTTLGDKELIVCTTNHRKATGSVHNTVKARGLSPSTGG